MSCLNVGTLKFTFTLEIWMTINSMCYRCIYFVVLYAKHLIYFFSLFLTFKVESMSLFPSFCTSSLHILHKFACFSAAYTHTQTKKLKNCAYVQCKFWSMQIFEWEISIVYTYCICVTAKKMPIPAFFVSSKKETTEIQVDQTAKPTVLILLFYTVYSNDLCSTCAK